MLVLEAEQEEQGGIPLSQARLPNSPKSKFRSFEASKLRSFEARFRKSCFSAPKASLQQLNMVEGLDIFSRVSEWFTSLARQQVKQQLEQEVRSLARRLKVACHCQCGALPPSLS